MRVALIAAVRIDPLRRALRQGVAIELLLDHADRARYARAATERRRAEFVAGRIAARCARAASGGGYVSISHARGLAVAAAGDRALGIDIEPSSRALPAAAFDLADTLVGWLVREAVGKLTGGGVLAPLDGRRRPAVIAAGRWCDHSICIAYAHREEGIDGPGDCLQGSHRRQDA